MSSYQPPTTSQTGATGGSTTYSSMNYSGADTSREVNYRCGDCDVEVRLQRGEPIRCKACGHRVLYKERTNRYVASSPAKLRAVLKRVLTFCDRMVQFQAV